MNCSAMTFRPGLDIEHLAGKVAERHQVAGTQKVSPARRIAFGNDRPPGKRGLSASSQVL